MAWLMNAAGHWPRQRPGTLQQAKAGAPHWIVHQVWPLVRRLGAGPEMKERAWERGRQRQRADGKSAASKFGSGRWVDWPRTTSLLHAKQAITYSEYHWGAHTHMGVATQMEGTTPRVNRVSCRKLPRGKPVAFGPHVQWGSIQAQGRQSHVSHSFSSTHWSDQARGARRVVAAHNHQGRVVMPVAGTKWPRNAQRSCEKLPNAPSTTSDPWPCTTPAAAASRQALHRGSCS